MYIIQLIYVGVLAVRYETSIIFIRAFIRVFRKAVANNAIAQFRIRHLYESIISRANRRGRGGFDHSKNWDAGHLRKIEYIKLAFFIYHGRR